MNVKAALLVLPATLAVTTLLTAGACRQREPEYCEDIETMSQCDGAEGCSWTDQDGCQNTCHEIEDQATCEGVDRCMWYPNEPDGGTTTGGEGGCEQVFS